MLIDAQNRGWQIARVFGDETYSYPGLTTFVALHSEGCVISGKSMARGEVTSVSENEKVSIKGGGEYIYYEPIAA